MYIQKKVYVQEFECVFKGSSAAKRSVSCKLSPSISYDSLMRVKGRLGYSSESYEYKHPIILPGRDLNVENMIQSVAGIVGRVLTQ